ncbi:PH domain-like protein [Lizonia empirigonia]|nr:PH domain-like protein [Lizonia empirigonia]
MPPHKSKARAHHPQPPPQPSDYETDAPPPALDVPLPPPRSNEELNVSVLRCIYPELLTLEHVTPYAALYTFSLETQQWEKLGVEGTLFLCKLTPSPLGADRYSVAILNRRGLDNFYLELTSEDEMEFTDPYVILQGDQVYGIWVFADPPPASTANCRIETAEKIMKAAEKARLSREGREREGKNGVHRASEYVETASSAPMGRQLSLRELFGQQRQQDAGFSVHDDHNQQMPHDYPQQQAYTPTPHPGMSQQDVLGQLFFNAKQNYNGLG